MRRPEVRWKSIWREQRLRHNHPGFRLHAQHPAAAAIALLCSAPADEASGLPSLAPAWAGPVRVRPEWDARPGLGWAGPGCGDGWKDGPGLTPHVLGPARPGREPSLGRYVVPGLAGGKSRVPRKAPAHISLCWLYGSTSQFQE